jgi:transporter family-2 protein
MLRIPNIYKKWNLGEVGPYMWGIIVAAISGALMSVQGIFNTGLMKQTSMWVSASFVQLTALIVCVVAWFVTGKEGNFAGIFNMEPKYMLLGGAIGAFITFTVIKAVNMLGPARAAIFIVTSQLLVAYVIELMGLFGVEKVGFGWRKAIGIALLVIGVVTFKWE